MEVSAVSVNPKVVSWSSDDTIAGNVSMVKKQAVSALDKELAEPQDLPVNQEELAKAVEEINKTLALHNTRLEFSIHDRTKEIMVKVLDEKTGETIREIPSKKVLDMVAMTWDELGLLVDEKA